MKIRKLKKCVCKLLAILIVSMMMITGAGQERKVMAAGFYYGDIDENGYVEANDALDILKHCVSLLQITNERTLALADMNGDENITAEDALMILKTCVNLLPLVSYDPVEVPVPDDSTKKVLVAYYSATGSTRSVAEMIADNLEADIFEITPVEEYTSEDLNWNNENSRVYVEHNDPDLRHVELVTAEVENFEDYDIVFIGYPIWWGEAPRIVSTFVESYDFSGKTIVPFCTSGGSGMGSSATNLEQLTSGAEWLSGERLSGSDSQDTVMEWVNGLGLNFEE